MIKTILFTASCLLFVMGCVSAQNLTLEKCYGLAESNYPLIRQYALIDQAEAYSITSAAKGLLPQFHVAGQASYQSDVTQLPVSLPNVDIPSVSKDQYKIYGEVSQPITDLFTLKHQRDFIQANAAVEKEKINVERYKLKERINQLYFGILLIDAQITQTEILKQDIHSGINKNRVAVVNGIALKSSAEMLQAELLKADQRTIELKASRKGYAEMLSLFINQPIDEQTILERPYPVALGEEINRPELASFTAQRNALDVQDKLIDTSALPRFSLFLQTGYGRPALNMLNNDFDWYYLGGVRLVWNIAGFYTHKQEKQLVSLDQKSLDVQKETFLFNTRLALRQQNSEITKLKELIQTDRDMIKLRENVKLSAQNQLEYGTTTANDYLAYIHAEDLARQNLILHELQLLLARYNFKSTSGN